MPTIIPKQDGLPEIHLFESVEALRASLGHAHTHGMYDKANNRIYATLSSLPHEIAHYRDFHSGQMPQPSSLADPAARRRARIRNEVVAIIFAWVKTRETQNLPIHEKQFLEWLYYMIDSGRVTPDEPLETMSFQKLQGFVEQVLFDTTDQEAVLAEIFKHYLADEEKNVDSSSRTKARA